MSEQKPAPQCCYFCQRDLPLWHVIGNIYTCAYCANERKLKNLRKVDVHFCHCGACSECKQRAVKEHRIAEMSESNVEVKR